MKLLLMKKDGIIRKVRAIDKETVQDMIDKGFEVVGQENLEPSGDLVEAVKEAIDALDIDGKIAKAVEEAIKAIQPPAQTPVQTPEQKPAPAQAPNKK